MPLTSGIRVVAAFEALKGVLVLLAGTGLISLIHHDAQTIAEHIVSHFHLNPASRYPHIFVDLAGKLSDQRLWTLALMAFAYASIRLVEAFGLWRERQWAEWLAALSGGIYLPVEIAELWHGINWIKLATFMTNICIVMYMLYVLSRRRKSASSAE